MKFQNKGCATCPLPPKIAANQSNAQLSTGPRTAKGKEASSPNATTGLAATRIFVRPGEEQIFQEFESALLAELQPEGINEEHLFSLILHATWNIRRCFELEEQIQNEANAKGSPDAMLDDELAPKLDRIYRYRKMHESTYRKAISELRRLQTEAVWRRETQELLNEPIVVDTMKILPSLSSLTAQRAVEEGKQSERDLMAYIQATPRPNAA